MSTLTAPLHHTRQELLQRGWTPALVKRFLGQPDFINVIRRRCPRVVEYLYANSLVEQAESSEEFRSAQEKARRRSERAKAVAAEKQRAWTDYFLDDCTLYLNTESSPDELRTSAINHYNDRQLRRRDWCDDEHWLASPNDNTAFLERITVNFIRHRLTNYDSLLHAIDQQIRGLEQQSILSNSVKRRLLQRIAAVYPHLADECERQQPQETQTND